MSPRNTETAAAAIDSVAIPVSIRLPAQQAFLLYLYAEQMSTSPGKLLGSLLDDVFPTFKTKKFDITLRIPQVYQAMEKAGLLKGVREQDLKDKLFKRTEPSGEGAGRPKKARSL